ncbi:NAD-specific glutamate dehydrogenase large form [Photobacterium aphoticum]|uniref:NAD-specific glutamate dehydrogenase large form n=1 Tax=Photobacterium aphoticum TaxID=754436 RepID=A0A090QKX9_9GAMM|nr:NAD-specific glutamate dehydrogenase large form [Photobacterium aphoticum]
MTTPDPIVPVLLEKVYGLIQDKIESSQQSLVEVFAQRLLGNWPMTISYNVMNPISMVRC